MHLDQEASEYLMKWAMMELEPLLGEDAELDVLGNFIMTLLSSGSDVSEEQLKKECVEQLTDFLKEETENFVFGLFDTIKGLFYLNLLYVG